jgi:hypothetical protein
VKTVVVLVLAAAFAAASSFVRAAEDPAVAKARAFFASWVELADAFDPKLAALYSDGARAINVRRYPGGEQRQMELDGARYKSLLEKSLPVAKSGGDRSTYSDLKFAVEGEYVVISATRFSHRKTWASPFSLRVGPIAAKDWKIVEERSESKAFPGETPPN